MLNSFSMLSWSFHYINPLLEIPAHTQKKLFPAALISVLGFLKFPLPNISGAALQQKASTFFSPDDPNRHDISNIPIPAAKIVAGLVEACTTVFPLENKSIKCSHLPSGSGQNLPVWIITYWAEVLVLCTTSCKAWVKAEEFLWQQKKLWKKSSSGETTYGPYHTRCIWCSIVPSLVQQYLWVWWLWAHTHACNICWLLIHLQLDKATKLTKKTRTD